RLPYTAINFAGRIVVLNTGYYTGAAKPEVSIVDPASGAVTQTLTFDALFPSAAVAAGDLFLSGGISEQVWRLDARFQTVRTYRINGYAAAIAPLEAGRLAVATLTTAATPADFAAGRYQRGAISILNTATGTVEREAPLGFFPYALCRTAGKLYAAILGENRVAVLDDRLQVLKSVTVEAAPLQLVADGDTLYAVNSSADSITLIDTGRDEVRGTLSVRGGHAKFGGAPTCLAVDADRLYVSLANINAVAVFDKRSHRLLGEVPTGFYPTCVLADESRLVTLSAKGVRLRRPNPRGPQPAVGPRSGPDYVLTLLNGSLGVIPKSEIDARLAGWSRTVEAGAPTASGEGLKPPIKHIFYIVRENRTYDQVLGDLPRANGDSFLTLFGREITPNGHRLCDEFVTLDNYYADGEISVLGHSFTTSGYASPFLEWLGNASYSGRYRGYPFGSSPGVTSPAYLWDALDARHVDYKIYGENYFLYTRAYDILRNDTGADSELTRKFHARTVAFASITDRGNLFYRLASPYYGRAQTVADAERLLDDAAFAGAFSEFLVGDGSLAEALKAQPRLKRDFAEYLTRYPANYRSWDLATSDLDRFAAWKADFDDQVKRRRVARLHYIWLPNDHTAGALTIPLPPDQLVAQNDAALGKIVETISHSPVWKDSLILVTEDDAQNGPDHVDATRTVGLAIGPYVKRGAVVSDRYDQLSMLRTVELLLGLPPLNRTDALAAPMLGIFADRPDFRPYDRPLLSSHLAPADRAKAEQPR
ncbi:MAG TPA: bifunctional YncE family protein/alkaline phosphatase family protein, partial [Chthonomonadaceae bacterium]|nr:bifunctional YncE family protein/alkaline phosphatase family protein [Chthonomonadaceae bacterium]